jgi:hypothetical protein
MSLASEFVFGVVFATLIGLFSNLINANRSASIAEYARMFTNPPHPRLKGGQVGADIEQSPLSVLGNGCLRIIVNAILIGSGVVALVLLIWGKSLVVTDNPFWVGVLHTGIFGFLLRAFFRNWQMIRNAYNRIVNPPNPTLPTFNPPNRHVVAANPAIPAFDVVVTSTTEISWRLVWAGVLVLLILFTLSSAADYTSQGAIEVSPTTIFDV